MDEVKDYEKLKPFNVEAGENIATELKEYKPKPAWDVDDKDLAMIGVVILAAIGAFFIDDPAELILGAIATLGSLAVGRKLINKQ